jgi:hypothetical protein
MLPLWSVRLGSMGLAVLAGALLGCADDRAAGDAGDTGAEGSTTSACDVCAKADVCCAAHTANPGGNCQLLMTCTSFTGAERLSVIDGCAYYLKVASTPPAPAACGPGPDDE